MLTSLFNRRHLNDTLPQMLAQALREQQPLATAVIDLHHAKAINDAHGHPAGDLLLAGFGRLLRAADDLLLRAKHEGRGRLRVPAAAPAG